MFNLSPIEDRDAIKTEYRRRVTIMALWFFLVGAVASLLLMVPSAFVDIVNHNRVKTVLADFHNKPEASDYAAFSEEVAATKTRLSHLRNYVPSRDNIAGTFKEIIDRKPKGVSIKIIGWSTKEKAIEIRLNGNATSRDLLLSFASALEESNLFTTVDVPASNYAKSENTDFSITLIIKRKS